MQYIQKKSLPISLGTDYEIVSQETLDPVKLSDHIFYWLDKVKAYTTKLGYEKYERCIQDIVTKGNSSVRQRNVFERTGEVYEVTAHNIKEFNLGEPIWS